MIPTYVPNPTPTMTPTMTATPSSSPAPQVVPLSYVGYCLSTGDIASDKECSYNSLESGTIYSSNGQRYRLSDLSDYAYPGLYCIVKGSVGYPNYSDSEFLLIS